MNISKQTFSRFTLLLSFLIGVASAFGQADVRAQAEPNYEAILYVVAGSAESGQGDNMPPGLSAIVKQLRSEFGVTSFKLLNTHFGRTTNSGSLEYKGVSNAYAPAGDMDPPTFFDWRLAGLRSSQNAAGQNAFQFQSFRFGARVPVRVANFRDEAGKIQSPLNYETIGLTLDRLGVIENLPTLVGTLSQPKTNGTLFLILTVKTALK